MSIISSSARAESFGAWTAKAEKLQKRGDAEGALGAYSQALKLWKKKDGKAAKSKILQARASLYEKGGAWSEALSDLTTAAALSTRTAAIPYRAGRACLALGNAPDAITWFYKATKLNLNYKEAYYDRARAYEATGDAQFAREDYKTACKLGVKAACGREKALKSGKAAGPPPPDEFAEVEQKKPRGPVEVRRKAPKVAKASVKNFPACLSGLDKCVEDGGTFGDCVSQAAVCEKGAQDGCCPDACVKAFKRAVNGKSEAEAFREVFKPKSSCLTPGQQSSGTEVDGSTDEKADEKPSPAEEKPAE